MAARRVLGLVLALAVAGGCAPSADDPRSRYDTARPTNGGFTIAYLSPPWQPVEVATDRVQLFIESTRQAIADAGASKFDLVATAEPGQVAARIAQEVTARTNAGDVIEAGPRPLVTLEGVMGQELVTSTADRDLRRLRIAYFPLAPNRVLRVYVEATPEVDTREVEALLSLVQIDE